MTTRELYFIHGWGVNSNIWQETLTYLKKLHPDFSLSAIDLPGYGTQVFAPPLISLEKLAAYCLQRAPRDAIWVGWSLGGMIAVQAAHQALVTNNHTIKGLQIVCSSAKFTSCKDWQYGMSGRLLTALGENFRTDYAQALRSFALLQSGHNRKLARQLTALNHPRPSLHTLQSGLDILATADTRQLLTDIRHSKLPVQVVYGEQDSLIPPPAAISLGQALGADTIAIACAHLPFISHLTAYTRALLSICQRS